MVFDQWKVYINPSQLENERVRRRKANLNHLAENLLTIHPRNNEEKNLQNL